MNNYENLLEVSQAVEMLLDSFGILGKESKNINDSLGRILAQEIVSGFDIPTYPISSMDGYAVRSQDVRLSTRVNPIQLNVIGEISAGVVSEVAIGKLEAVRIMTGAVIPGGADAVVPIENTNIGTQRISSQDLDYVKILTSVHSGDYIRQYGEDIVKGSVVLHIGKQLTPYDLGLLAMLGIPSVRVYKSPRIAIFSSGDELIPPDKPRDPGKIYDANRFALNSLVRSAGGVPIDLGIVSDDPGEVKTCLDKAVSSDAELIISSAGVSVGQHDYVRSVLEEYGQLRFWRVNMRPGKPIAFGFYNGVHFVGLPGNPVSSCVGFEVFIRPAIKKMAGSRDFFQPRVRVQLIDPIRSDGRESYLRSIVFQEGGVFYAKLTGHQGSGNLLSLVQANALLILPAGVKHLASGDVVEAIKLSDSIFQHSMV